MNINPIEKFKKERNDNIKRVKKNNNLKKLSFEFYKNSWKENYSYNFDWLGRPVIQYPQDLIAMQEIIWDIKPDLIIETGIAHGGSLIFYASLMEIIGKGQVLGIDIDIRSHNNKKIIEHPMFNRIKMIEGSSVEDETINKVKKIVKKNKTILVSLDSMHTHEHVLEELEIYSNFVTKNSYIVVFDTAIKYMPDDWFNDRPWSTGNNPATAVEEFLSQNLNFVVDTDIENKILITSAPGGFLKKIN